METYRQTTDPGLPENRRPTSPPESQTQPTQSTQSTRSTRVTHMTRPERAKQFMAFDAMKGLQEALRDREERHSREPRRVFCEEEAQVLDGKLRRLRAGMTVRLTYYCRFHECTRTDVVREVGESSLRLGQEWVDFADVYRVAVSELPRGQG